MASAAWLPPIGRKPAAMAKKIKLTPQQRRAIETLEGPLFVAAGAGSGKTGVVTRRFVHAVASGYARVDQILTITFTKKAAAEMMARIRELLSGRESIGVLDDAAKERMSAACREIERARISTIDAFCASVLRTHALATGIDPDFAVVDGSQAAMIQEEVFDPSLEALIKKYGPAAVEFITAYDPNMDGSLFKAVTKAQATLRSQGRQVTLPCPGPPDIDGAKRDLREAVREARAAVAQIAKPNKDQATGISRLERLEQALAETNPVKQIELAETGEVKFKKMGPAREEFSRLELPRLALLNALRSREAAGTLNLFRELLEQFHSSYSEKKHEAGVMDFADLALQTRDLLKSSIRARNQMSSSFRLVMVDEFQDTNPLQFDVIKRVAGSNLFIVGDENQAIYGFRDAEVALFQQEKKKAREHGYLVELEDNFRSQREIIRFVDHVFNRDDMLSPGYLELNPAVAADAEKEDCRIEIMLVDCRRDEKKVGLKRINKEVTRPAEAQLIARRLQDLFAQGYAPGDAAILLSTSTDAEVYRDALTQAGIENHFSVGKGYFSKLELHDVVNMFKLIINPLDDLAMLGVLRSPLTGLSDNALYWLYHANAGKKTKQSAWLSLHSLERLERLDKADRKKAARFISWLEELRKEAGRLSLRELAEKVINIDDYAAKIAAGPNGEQGFANLMKLLDLASDFEAAWSNDLASFTQFLERQKTTESGEAEAPMEAEGAQAVRIMTMHSAKGLEFPLVVLPNLQASGKGKNNAPVLLFDRSGKNRIGLKYKTDGSGSGDAFDYDELWQEEVRRCNLESKRLGYVAMTRAEKHLILSGVAPADRLPKKDKQHDPPFDWLRNIFNLKWPRDENLGKAGRLDQIKGSAVRLHICTDAVKAAGSGLPGPATSRPEPPRVNAGIASLPQPAIYVPPEISPTALDTFKACPRRYFLDHVLHAGDIFPVKGERTGSDDDGLSATQLGLLVHGVLENEDLETITSAPAANEVFDKHARRVVEITTGLKQRDYERARRLIGNFSRAPAAQALCRAAAAGALAREVPFSTLVGNTIIQGQMDAMHPAGFGGSPEKDGIIIVDYKTGVARMPEKPGSDTLPYRLQTAAYALAAARMQAGPVRVILIYLGGDEPLEVIQDYEADQAAVIESELLSVIGSMSDGSFPPLDEFDAYYCTWCSGGPRCAGLCPTGARIGQNR